MADDDDQRWDKHGAKRDFNRSANAQSDRDNESVQEIPDSEKSDKQLKEERDALLRDRKFDNQRGPQPEQRPKGPGGRAQEEADRQKFEEQQQHINNREQAIHEKSQELNRRERERDENTRSR